MGLPLLGWVELSFSQKKQPPSKLVKRFFLKKFVTDSHGLKSSKKEKNVPFLSVLNCPKMVTEDKISRGGNPRTQTPIIVCAARVGVLAGGSPGDTEAPWCGVMRISRCRLNGPLVTVAPGLHLWRAWV